MLHSKSLSTERQIWANSNAFLTFYVSFDGLNPKIIIHSSRNATLFNSKTPIYTFSLVLFIFIAAVPAGVFLFTTKHMQWLKVWIISWIACFIDRN